MKLILQCLCILSFGSTISVYAGGDEYADVINDKPYQITDGNIDANTIEGWKTYNGGGCGACHGPGGVGAVASSLADSLATKIDKKTFIDTIVNGKPGTLMVSHKTNIRVMDNLDNLFAYIKARADGVLGPENLIKYPLGKKE